MQEIASLLKPAAQVRSATVRIVPIFTIEMTAGTGADCDRCKKRHAHSCIRKLVPDSPELPHSIGVPKKPECDAPCGNVRSNNDSMPVKVFNDLSGWSILS